MLAKYCVTGLERRKAILWWIHNSAPYRAGAITSQQFEGLKFSHTGWKMVEHQVEVEVPAVVFTLDRGSHQEKMTCSKINVSKHN
ncbi:hypothetical protein ATANTOWER_004194 [Ataeniobius toweri]|uniref:Uncharacterized protein n=1 Tax=Ataeniobius toweri TaxID=208326 RepID=A0ABU7C0E9_9TELE|nr:hypothetical protein [Ataeniobius toweri]